MGRSRKRHREPVSLDAGAIKSVSAEEIGLILRGMDALAGEGGRTKLVKILRGSRAKDILPFADTPAHGSFSGQSADEVLQKVDWCILNQWIRLDWQSDFPLLVYTEKGLVQECLTVAEEVLQLLSKDPKKAIEQTKNLPMKTLYALFDRVAEAGPAFFREPLLQWHPEGTKRMKAEIDRIFREWEGKSALRRYVFKHGYIDENISELDLNISRKALKEAHVAIGDYRFVGDEFPGAADVDIFRLISGIPRTCLVTVDRPFHNALVEEGFQSLFLDRETGGYIRDLLPGIKPRGIFREMGSDSVIARHAPEEKVAKVNQLPEFLRPKTPRHQKRTRTKRRRIRNYFGGLSRMESCRITMSIRPSNEVHLLGVRVQITSNSDLKSLDATEGYFRLAADRAPAAAFATVLIELLQLGIREVPTVFYLDADCPLKHPDEVLEGAEHHFWTFLVNELNAKIAFEDSSGRNIRMQRMQKKLKDLASGKSNELRDFDYDAYLKGFKAHP